MGWDAYSSAKVDYQNRKLKDNKLDKVFKDASDFVRKKTHSVDSLLRLGGLDVSNCATMLQTAVSIGVR